MKTKAKEQTEYTKREQEHVDASWRLDAFFHGESDKTLRQRIRDKLKRLEEAKAK